MATGIYVAIAVIFFILGASVVGTEVSVVYYDKPQSSIMARLGRL